MPRVPATEFKARCLELMDRVSERRETYVITKRGRPVARLVPVERGGGEPLFGRLRGWVEEEGDIMRPVVPPEAWETLKEWDELLNVPGTRRPRKTRTKRNRSRASKR
jgi:prevent-host-death family protein